MPRLKVVPSLAVLSNGVVSRHLANACFVAEKNQDSEEFDQNRSSIESYLSELPTNILESIVLITINVLTSGERQKNSCGLPFALRYLPQPAVTQLDFGQLFSETRLSRSMNSLCRASLQESLSRTVNLSKLVLTSKCTNDILETLGKNCLKLKDLYISLSEMVTDEGLQWLVPNKMDVSGCPQLVTLDLIKCWNVSPAGAHLLLVELKKLRKLLFSNMKSVMELVMQSDKTGGPFCLEYFDSSEYDLITGSEVGMSQPDTNPACWMSGPVKMVDIPIMFPHITIIKMMLSDSEVKLLTNVQSLVHIEVEFSDDPGPGLQHLLDCHPNVANFILLFFQVGPILGSHLLSIAKHCLKLGFLRIIGFNVENPTLLQPNSKYFQCMTQLHLSLYDDSNLYGDSSDEEEEHDHVSRHSAEIVQFFLCSARNIEVINIHMNFESFMSENFLKNIVSKNSLFKTTRLALSGPKDLKLDLSNVYWLLDMLPELSSLLVSKWNVNHKELKALRNEAKRNNLDIVFT